MMTSCKEFVLDDLMAITAIPVGDFVPGTAAWQLTPTIKGGEFSPNLQNATVIGRQAAVTGGRLVPIRKLTGKAKDDEGDSVAGRLHTVTVTCQVDDRDLTADGNGDTALDYLLRLQRTPAHLLLTFRDQTRAFVSATQDTYNCEVERDGAKVSVQFKIQNYMGAQIIV